MPWEVEARPGKPLEQVYPSEAGPGLRMGTEGSSRPELSPNALRAWMSMLRSQAAVPSTDPDDGRWRVARGRLFLLHNVCHSLVVSVPKKEASIKMRARHRHVWSEAEADTVLKAGERAGDGEGAAADAEADKEAEATIHSYQAEMERRRLQKTLLTQLIQ